MTTKELLELAAKAACIDPNQWFSDCDNCESIIQWNPLTDNSDAFCLAVKLRIDIGEAVEWYFTDKEFENDPYAATRRAIVRAAAEIGKGMA